ncbi:MAG: 30S ribosomal protein S11, partial [Deltaproteobacteria bacterium]
QLAAQDALQQAMDQGLRVAEVRVKGPGVGREAALRALQVDGFSVSMIRDVTPIPHNGCRPPKRRRV